MSDLRFNTIAGVVLASGVLIMGLREVGTIVFHPHYPETPGYAVEIQAAAPSGPVEEAAPVQPDFGRLFADTAQLTALIAEGDKVHKQCASCHQVEKGAANGTGPALWDVFGRVAGAHEGFAYSDAMKAYAKPWSYDNLYAFLAAPAKYIPGTKMSYAGLRRSDDRVALVAYLRSLSDSPAALPAPLPEAAPPAAEEAAAPEAAPAAAAPPT